MTIALLLNIIPYRFMDILFRQLIQSGMLMNNILDTHIWRITMTQCACGSDMDYLDCCGMYLSGIAIPKTPEALMRSRYTAYSKADIDYIKKTMQGKPLVNFNEVEAKHWAASVQWLGLNVVKSSTKVTDKNIGFVEFIATYIDKGILKTIHEISQFRYIDLAWFYIDGEQPGEIKPQKISRNAPCPCGSKKKFKNCHARY